MKTLEDVLEEIRPTPDPDFVADMERRMQLGFPPPRKRRLSRVDLASFRPRQFAAVGRAEDLIGQAVEIVRVRGERELGRALDPADVRVRGDIGLDSAASRRRCYGVLELPVEGLGARC